MCLEPKAFLASEASLAMAALQGVTAYQAALPLGIKAFLASKAILKIWSYSPLGCLAHGVKGLPCVLGKL